MLPFSNDFTMLKAIALSFLFVFVGLSRVSAAIPDSVSVRGTTTVTALQQKSGWLKRLTQVSLFRHANQQDSLSQEKPSRLARAADLLLGVSNVGTAVFGNLFMPVAFVGLAGILVANVLAI
ncbi:MAG TPA: hypothetical protein DCF33_16795, partial [Saprospirales bacterium]|nr:hypothetical protein [Saprospirales bacterium]